MFGNNIRAQNINFVLFRWIICKFIMIIAFSTAIFLDHQKEPLNMVLIFLNSGKEYLNYKEMFLLMNTKKSKTFRTTSPHAPTPPSQYCAGNFPTIVCYHNTRFVFTRIQ